MSRRTHEQQIGVPRVPQRASGLRGQRPPRLSSQSRRRVKRRAAVGRRAGTVSNKSEDKHSWDRVPSWDGDKRQWKRYLCDIELYFETEKLDVDFSHGARLLSRMAGSARKYAETIELDQIRPSTGTDRDTREGMTAGVKYLLKSLE